MQETADLATFTEEILNGKLHFLCSAGRLLTDRYTLFVFMIYIHFFEVPQRIVKIKAFVVFFGKKYLVP